MPKEAMAVRPEVIRFALDEADFKGMADAVKRMEVNAAVDTAQPGAFTIRNHTFQVNEPGAFAIRNYNFNTKQPGAFAIRNYRFVAR
jgi:hypothetical protein